MENNILRTYMAQSEEKISIEKLAQEMGLSREHLSRKFRMKYNCSLQDYLMGIRLAQARRLLCISDMTIQEIASRLGWEDASCFYKVFRRKIGLTPRQYRSCHKEDG